MADKPESGRTRRRRREALERKSEATRMRTEEKALLSPERPQDELSSRAKSSGHKKKTADKWNQ